MSATATINIRVPPEQRAIIDRAAKALGKSRSAFILETAAAAAEDVLLNQRHFELDPEQWAALAAALDAPPQPSLLLRRLLTSPAPWEAGA
ncbi:MAG: DUF1778 domain-containing protein [Thermodesulfobacteriota bacterium]